MPLDWTTGDLMVPAGCLPCCVASYCPGTDKMLLPTLTESTGTWYADCAAAAAVLTSSSVSNCIGYFSGKSLSTFTATDGGTSLTLEHTITASGVGGNSMWASINAVSGQTITVTGSVGSGTPEVYITIYDNTGTVFEDTGTFVSSPFTSTALSYTGRYILHIRVRTTGSSTSFSSVTTSTGTITVNQIQALYDTGGADPSCLNCGDAC